METQEKKKTFKLPTVGEWWTPLDSCVRVVMIQVEPYDREVLEKFIMATTSDRLCLMTEMMRARGLQVSIAFSLITE